MKPVNDKFDPDFGDIPKSEYERPVRIYSNQKEKKPFQCYVCSENRRVVDCSTFANCSSGERIRLGRLRRFCFCCVNQRKGVDVRIPPPPAPRRTLTKTAKSAFDKVSIMPVVRVRFKSANGRSRGRNVLVDSGIGTTVIRKNSQELWVFKEERKKSI